MAGPSKVRFFGPSTDEELSIARSCESRYHVKAGVQRVTFKQTDICTRRFPTAVLVSP